MKEAKKEALESLDLEEIEELVKNYQSQYGLKADGWPGEKTMAVLSPRLASVSTRREETEDTQASAYDRVGRARSAVGLDIKYKLGWGGGNPASLSPATNGLCDCSGLAAWVIGLPREHRYGTEGWINTDAMIDDAESLQVLFRPIDSPVPGCLVVYGKNNGRNGHVGLVTAIEYDDESGKVVGLTVIDCSLTVSKRTGRAISERDGSFFLKKDHAFVVPKV